MSDNDQASTPKRGPGRPPKTDGEVKEPKPKSYTLSDKDKDQLLRARAAQSQRRKAPPISVNRTLMVPQHELFARMAIADGGKDAKPDQPGGNHYANFENKPGEIARLTALGYEIARDGQGSVGTIQGDICMKIPMDIYTSELQGIAERGMRQINRSIKKDVEEVKRGGLQDAQGTQITTEQRGADELGL